MTLLDETLAEIRPLDAAAVAEARDRQGRLTKPRGSLGVLEELSAQLAGLAGSCPPPVPEPAAVAVFAGDHGVHARGVTAWPQEVTAQMVGNFLAGGAVVNALAAPAGATVRVVDVGVAADLAPLPGLSVAKIRYGTADFTTEPAMSRSRGAAGGRGRDRRRARPRRRRGRLPARRRHGHRQHHAVRRAHRGLHRLGPGGR